MGSALKDYKHTHSWYRRTLYDRPGYYITGYVCSCGKKDYVDLVKGIMGDESKIPEGVQRKV